MFEAKKVMMMYCTSPVHAGAGQAFGLIDNPIQRERHTEHPMIAGSGVKGAVRHHLWRKWNNGDEKETRELLNPIFGPEAAKSSDYAGAISFTDAQLLVFPIRCVKNGFVYATSPLALARAKRMLAMCGQTVDWNVPTINSGQAQLLNDALKSGEHILLESQQCEVVKNDAIQSIANDLANFAIADGGYFHDKLKHDLVILSDTDFGWFVKNATVVEAHVKIDPETGTAVDGALHYSENLPPESIMVAAVMATQERSKESGLQADAVLEHVVGALRNSMVQMGGDATTGRGQMQIHFAGERHD